jgi:hypothetical protein
MVALDPPPAREPGLRSHADTARLVLNWELARCRERYDAGGRWYSGTGLHRRRNAEKKQDPALA